MCTFGALNVPYESVAERLYNYKKLVVSTYSKFVVFLWNKDNCLQARGAADVSTVGGPSAAGISKNTLFHMVM